MKFENILIAMLWLMGSCTLQRSTLSKVGKIVTVEDANQLISKNPQLRPEILQLDSVGFYSHPIYKGLRPGVTHRIGNESPGEANIYKLLDKPLGGAIYSVLHIRVVSN